MKVSFYSNQVNNANHQQHQPHHIHKFQHHLVYILKMDLNLMNHYNIIFLINLFLEYRLIKFFHNYIYADHSCSLIDMHIQQEPNIRFRLYQYVYIFHIFKIDMTYIMGVLKILLNLHLNQLQEHNGHLQNSINQRHSLQYHRNFILSVFQYKYVLTHPIV